MITWTPENVLCAIDAGIVTVISVFNSSYTWALRQTNPIDQHPFTAKTAYTFAMNATIAYLTDIEQRVARENAAAEKLIKAMNQSDLVDAMSYEYNASNGYTN